MNKKGKILKLILFILVIVIITATIIYIFPVIKKLSKPEGQLEFKEKIDNLGFLGILALFGLQIAQIFLVIIPGEPIEVLAGICYGGLGGFIFILTSAALISGMIIVLVRKLGRRFVYEFCSKEKIEKIENSKVFKNSKKIELIMLILFLIPGTPKDLLVYIAALLPINPVKFIIVSSIARIPSILSSTFAGEHLLAGNWKISILIYAITFLVVGIILFVANKLDKENVTKDVLDSINSK